MPVGQLGNSRYGLFKSWQEIMQSEFVELGTYYNHLEAEVDRGLLAENGIKARISKDDCGGMMPNLQNSEGVRLHVKRSDLDKAQLIVAHDKSSSTNLETDDGKAETWTCSSCGEVLEPQFTDCWNCGTSRESELPITHE